MLYVFGVAVQARLDDLPLPLPPLLQGHVLVQVLGEDLLLLEVSDITGAVIRQLDVAFLCTALCPLLGAPFLGDLLTALQLLLLFLDIVEELLDVLEGVDIRRLVFLAAGAVHELMLLAHKILHNTFQFWVEVSLGAVKLEVLHVPRELVQVDRLDLALPDSLGHASLRDVSLLLFLGLDDLLLMLAKLLLKDLVSDLELRDLVQIVVRKVLDVLLRHIDLEDWWIGLDLLEVTLVELVEAVRRVLLLSRLWPRAEAFVTAGDVRVPDQPGIAR